MARSDDHSAGAEARRAALVFSFRCGVGTFYIINVIQWTPCRCAAVVMVSLALGRVVVHGGLQPRLRRHDDAEQLLRPGIHILRGEAGAASWGHSSRRAEARWKWWRALARTDGIAQAQARRGPRTAHSCVSSSSARSTPPHSSKCRTIISTPVSVLREASAEAEPKRHAQSRGRAGRQAGSHASGDETRRGAAQRVPAV